MDEKEKLKQYGKLLERAPSLKIVLMEKPDSPRFFEKQVLEASFYLPYIKSGDTVLDIGSGGGFPGIPLSIMKQDANFILLDRKKKHFDFLNFVINELSIKNAKPLLLDASMLKNKKNVRADVVCARAVTRIKNILEWVAPVLKNGGFVVLGKGKNIEKEISDAENLPYKLEGMANTEFGHIVVYKKLDSK